MMSDVKKERFVKTLTQAYKKEDYVLFLKELLTNMQIVAPDKDNEPFHTFAAAVAKYNHIGNYVGDDNKKVALFSVCLLPVQPQTHLKTLIPPLSGPFLLSWPQAGPAFLCACC